VERAFGVQDIWKSVATPIQTIDPKYIASMVSCCLILHYMGVSDCVMDDDVKTTRYDPGGSVLVGEVEEEKEDDDEESPMVAITGNGDSSTPPLSPSTHTLLVPLPVLATTTTIRAFDVEHDARVITQREEVKGPNDEAECYRLQKALITWCVNSRKLKI
jgi:hypothetical protein